VRRQAAVSGRRNGSGGPPSLDARHVHLTANPDGTLALRCGRQTWKRVRVRLGRPLYKPHEFATVFEEPKGEVALIVGLDRLSPQSRQVLEDHLRRHDLTATIRKVTRLHHQFGSAFWEVETDKGLRQFVIRGTTEHVRWLDDDRMLITDVHGNRFEIPSLSALDRRSQTLISLIL
jgi:hypothetical protein